MSEWVKQYEEARLGSYLLCTKISDCIDVVATLIQMTNWRKTNQV